LIAAKHAQPTGSQAAGSGHNVAGGGEILAGATRAIGERGRCSDNRRGGAWAKLRYAHGKSHSWEENNE
jgi:hypothetical protein